MAHGFEAEVRFGDYMQITADVTYVRLEGDFTENPTELINAHRKLKDRYHPTSLEVHREDITVATEEGDVELPILVYDAWWDHSLTHLRPSFMLEPEPEDRVPTYPLDEYDVFVAE